MEVEEETYTPAEAGRVLGITKRQVLNYLSDGDLEGQQDSSGRWSIPKRAAHELLEKRRAAGRSPRRGGSSSSEARESPVSAAELLDRVFTLERELGRAEARIELSELTESTLRGRLAEFEARADEQKARAESLERELKAALQAADEAKQEAQKGWLRRFFGL